MENNTCKCGHSKEAHIYHEGACRTGAVICSCQAYVSMENKGEQMTKKEKIIAVLGILLIVVISLPLFIYGFKIWVYFLQDSIVFNGRLL